MSQEINIEEVLERYGRIKDEISPLKKQNDADNTTIKEYMKAGNFSDLRSENYKAKLSVIEQLSFDDEKLVDKLNEMADESGKNEYDTVSHSPYVDVILVPNMEAIENAIYNNELSASELSDCQIKNTQVRLTITKFK